MLITQWVILAGSHLKQRVMKRNIITVGNNGPVLTIDQREMAAERQWPDNPGLDSSAREPGPIEQRQLFRLGCQTGKSGAGGIGFSRDQFVARLIIQMLESEVHSFRKIFSATNRSSRVSRLCKLNPCHPRPEFRAERNYRTRARSEIFLRTSDRRSAPVVLPS